MSSKIWSCVAKITKMEKNRKSGTSSLFSPFPIDTLKN